MTMLTKPKRPCRVALLLGFNYQRHLNFVEAVRRSMSGDKRFVITYVNVPITEEAIREKVVSLVNSTNPPDIFVPLGLRCSLHLKQVVREIGRGRIAYLGVRDPLSHGLIDSFEKPGQDSTAIVCDPSLNTVVAEKLAAIVKYINRVIIPHSTLCDKKVIEQQIAEIIEFFRPHGLIVEPLEIAGDEESLKREVPKALKGKIVKHDVVLILESALPDVDVEAAYLCWDRDALLCDDALSSLYSGAACALGGELDAIAIALRDTLTSYWIDEVSLGDISVKRIPNDRAFFVNVAILRMIGFPEEAIAVFSKLEETIVIKKWIDCPVGRSGS
ncbi:MAG: transporter substrate binding protein [Candidatus Dependentiae bacterium]|nr:transporter substrate binding protein [Candidatus Dependentiae bacterium]